jgi:hypothetical protein
VSVCGWSTIASWILEIYVRNKTVQSSAITYNIIGISIGLADNEQVIDIIRDLDLVPVCMDIENITRGHGGNAVIDIKSRYREVGLGGGHAGLGETLSDSGPRVANYKSLQVQQRSGSCCGPYIGHFQAGNGATGAHSHMVTCGTNQAI